MYLRRAMDELSAGVRAEPSPTTGPRLLFFSGGSALNGLAKALTKHTHNSIHLVTPFDSGGSSATLRRAFDMPAVGDLRSRLMALAEDSCEGHEALYRLMTLRLNGANGSQTLRRQVEAIAAGQSDLATHLTQPTRGIVCLYLQTFLDAVPSDFDFSGASIGNLVLAGGYLHDNRTLEPVTFLLNELLNVRGLVSPITEAFAELKIKTASGRSIIGQHLVTGKEHQPLGERINEIELDRPVELPSQQAKLIRSADLIVFPPGSFYSSVLANLLPEGVGKAVLENPAPRVYVPNLGNDPEQYGMSLKDQVLKLDQAIRKGTGDLSPELCIDLVLTDSNLLPEADDEFAEWLNQRSVQFVDLDLADTASETRYDDLKLCEALLSLT